MVVEHYGTLLGHSFYSVGFWLPSDRKDMKPSERVHKGFTRMLPWLELYEADIVWAEDFSLEKWICGKFNEDALTCETARKDE